jgi:6-phosphogluconolactonase
MKFSDESLFVAPTPVKLAEELAGWVFTQTNITNNNDEPFCMVISGGSTPILLFKQLSDGYKDLINWKRIHFFWADERCVPPDNIDSNYGSAYNNLLSKIPIPEHNIHRMKGEIAPMKAAEAYTKEINTVVRKENGYPEFDLVLLGMGDDGHTASLFPEHPQFLHSKNICEASLDPKGKNRITLTPQCINKAKKVVFQITGMNKSAIVNDILLQFPGYTNYPAAHIKPENRNLYWFLDAGAANGLFG